MGLARRATQRSSFNCPCALWVPAWKGHAALLALLDDVIRHRLGRAALYPRPSKPGTRPLPILRQAPSIASLCKGRSSSFPFLLQTALNRPQRYSDKDGRKTGSADLPGVCPENYSDVILQRTGVKKATFRLQECVSSVGLRESNMRGPKGRQ